MVCNIMVCRKQLQKYFITLLLLYSTYNIMTEGLPVAHYRYTQGNSPIQTVKFKDNPSDWEKSSFGVPIMIQQSYMTKLVAMSPKYLNVRLEPGITYMSFNPLINNKQHNLSYGFIMLLKVYLTTTYQDIQIVISVDQLQPT